MQDRVITTIDQEVNRLDLSSRKVQSANIGIHLRHTPYDLPQAAARIRATNYPQAETFATLNLLYPPSEAEALEAFTRVQLK